VKAITDVLRVWLSVCVSVRPKDVGVLVRALNRVVEFSRRKLGTTFIHGVCFVGRKETYTIS